MEIELRTCPFCGGKAELIEAPSNKYLHIPCYGVRCTCCNVMIGTTEEGKTDFFRTPYLAARAWNTRVYDNVTLKA